MPWTYLIECWRILFEYLANFLKAINCFFVLSALMQVLLVLSTFGVPLVENCQNGVDDNRDGIIDEGCSRGIPFTSEVCSNNRDDNYDRRVDEPVDEFGNPCVPFFQAYDGFECCFLPQNPKSKIGQPQSATFTCRRNLRSIKEH